LTPRASSTSALPERLEMERLPCLATGIPAEAATMAVAVEILKVLSPPPVPQVSMSSSCNRGRRGMQLARMALAREVISLREDPFISRATWKPAICRSLTSSLLMALMSPKISSSDNSWLVVAFFSRFLYMPISLRMSGAIEFTLFFGGILLFCSGAVPVHRPI